VSATDAPSTAGGLLPAVDPATGQVPRHVIDAVLAAVEDSFDEFIDELMDVCRLRSRRSEPEQMVATAEWIRDNIVAHGGTAESIPWEHSHPYVLGEIPGGERRLLHFNHYDVEVEPTGDESAWSSPPYSPEIRDGRVYARGVGDDKGAVMSRIHAAAAWRRAGYEPPVTSVFMVEGKQSLHSPGMQSFFEAHRDQLRSHGTLWENSWIDTAGRPLLKLGEKGILYLEVAVRTLEREVTSQNAALLPSAISRLVAALATLQNDDGSPAVDGLDEGVRRLTDAERSLLDEVAFNGDFVRQRAGVHSFLGGVTDDAATEAVRMHTTLVITGIEGGDTRRDLTLGVPASARAKVEIRLVAGQDCRTVLGNVRRHFDRHGFEDVTIDVLGASQPNGTDHRDPFVSLVADAARVAYDIEPVVEPFTTWIGNQGTFAGRPIVGVGVSRVESGIDGPDENILLDDYRTGLRHTIEVMAAMAGADDLTEVR